MENNTKPKAHVKINADGSWSEPQYLDEHLIKTSELAGCFAKVFNSESWGRAAGLCHDIGKSTNEWQEYLCKSSGMIDEETHDTINKRKIDHSSPSAKLAEIFFGTARGRILSYCIAGHHAGLPDYYGSQSSLKFRIQNTSITNIREEATKILKEVNDFTPPWGFERHGLDLSLWIRMIFSCLVDADFLDTEEYMDDEKASLRCGYLPISKILGRFNSYIDDIIRTANINGETRVNKARRRVLEDCRKAAQLEPGFFSLTVPTGGGKTLSSMAFALEHSVKYGKQRIIYVIPYTSIIEQNADVFRAAIGSDQVIEHHSNLDEENSTLRSKLAAENWDAPIIVTTSVQFFESLFAAKPSRCRKLHNIANSVVILDEAQLVPIEFLGPILSTMKLLVDHYKVTFVICTATKPAFEERDDFKGLPQGCIREIVQDVPRLYSELRRVDVPPIDTKTPKNWEQIAEELSAFDRVLCIVSDRKSCRELYRLMPEGTYHLSALMCAQHRSDIIREIKEKLKQNDTVRVISTQLIEAGVDIDFPVVYRAMAGLDSIAQAAGRCNREGRLNTEGKLGKVIVFVPPRKAPVGLLRKAAETTVRLLDSGLNDPIDHAVFDTYFSELYWKANSIDKEGIIKLLEPDTSDCGIQFRTAAESFKIIDDSNQRTILVPYNEGADLIRQLASIGPERWILRKLQRYTVNVYTDQFNALQKRGSLKEVSFGIFALECDVEYDKKIGLLIDEMPTDPTSYMIFT